MKTLISIGQIQRYLSTRIFSIDNRDNFKGQTLRWNVDYQYTVTVSLYIELWSQIQYVEKNYITSHYLHEANLHSLATVSPTARLSVVYMILLVVMLVGLQHEPGKGHGQSPQHVAPLSTQTPESCGHETFHSHPENITYGKQCSYANDKFYKGYMCGYSFMAWQLTNRGDDGTNGPG